MTGWDMAGMIKGPLRYALKSQLGLKRGMGRCLMGNIGTWEPIEIEPLRTGLTNCYDEDLILNNYAC